MTNIPDILIEQFSNCETEFGLHPHDVKNILEKFFEEYLCIKRGEDPHEFSEELHRWIEGEVLQLKFKEDGEWYDRLETAKETFDVFYRIKPADFEYQWFVIINKQAHLVGDGRFHTDEELKKFPYYIKIEETKRIRQ